MENTTINDTMHDKHQHVKSFARNQTTNISMKREISLNFTKICDELDLSAFLKITGCSLLSPFPSASKFTASEIHLALSYEGI